MSKKTLALAVAAAVIILPSPSLFATNGYFAHGYSIKEKGTVGAGVANSQDTLAAATNPAGMIWQGNRVDLGLSLFSPMRHYKVDNGPPAPPFAANVGAGGPNSEVESDNEAFFIPSFGWNKMLNPDSSFGVSVYGNGGMNTEYQPSDTFGGGGTFGSGRRTGVDLAQLFINATYARKLSANAAWGVSAIFAYQTFEAQGLAPFAPFSVDPTSLSDRGKDSSTGFGAKLGWQGEVAPGVTLGASYQSQIKMGELKDYKGLFADGGDFDIPATATIGAAWKVTPTSKLLLDVQKIFYNDVDAVGNSSTKLLTGGCAPGAGPGGSGVGSGCLGGTAGAGFGWDDMTIIKLGYEWESGADWIWRVGYSQGDHPIQKADVLFNILAPAVVEQHITFGFTKKMGKSNEFNFAAMYAPEECLKAPSNPLGAAGSQTTEICMDQYELAASWAWKF